MLSIATSIHRFRKWEKTPVFYIIINGRIDLNLFIEEIIKAGYAPEDSVGK